MHFSSTACTVLSLLDAVNNHPRDDATLLHRSCSRQYIRYSLQSSNGCASPVPLVQSSVDWVRLQTNIRGMPSWNAGLYTGGLLVSVYNNSWNAFISASIDLSVSVYNHPRDASIGGTLVQVLVYWSLFLPCWCIYRFIGLGRMYWSIGLVCNHPRDASISALLVHLLLSGS